MDGLSEHNRAPIPSLGASTHPNDPLFATASIFKRLTPNLFFFETIYIFQKMRQDCRKRGADFQSKPTSPPRGAPG